MTQVILNVYDFSEILYKVAPEFKFTRLVHTGIEIFGKEYFFGKGIEIFPPGTTPFGKRTYFIEMGETEFSEEEFIDFIEDSKTIYSLNSYSVFDNNCNYFSNYVVNYLLGGSNIPQEFLNSKIFKGTPLGAVMEKFSYDLINRRMTASDLIKQQTSK